jgi:hypothetical protein
MIDILLDTFERVGKRTPPMLWWSICVPEDVTANGGIHVAQNRWGELLQHDYDWTLTNLGGLGTADRKQWTLYAVTGKGVGLADYQMIVGACVDAVNRLGLAGLRQAKGSPQEILIVEEGPLKGYIVRPVTYPERQYYRREQGYRLLWTYESPEFMLDVSDYLATFPVGMSAGRTESTWTASRGMAIWFDFLWWSRQDIGLRFQERHEPSINWEERPTWVPYRTIEHDICEASILALRFLRQKAVERMELLEDTRREGTDLATAGQRKDRRGPGQASEKTEHKAGGDAITDIERAIRLIEELNREKERYARWREALPRDTPWVQVNETLERDWQDNIQPLIEDIQTILKSQRAPIRAYWPNARRLKWDTFYNAVAEGKDNYDRWKKSGWPEIHIQELQAVSRALASMEQKQPEAGRADSPSSGHAKDEKGPGQGGGTPKRGGKGGRKPLSAKEATKRQAAVEDWRSARDAGISKYDFCEDQKIDPAYLDKCLDWNRHRQESHQ